MKRLIVIAWVCIGAVSTFAQNFENFVSGYVGSYSMYVNDSVIYIGGVNSINVYRTDGSYIESHYVPGTVYSISKDTAGVMVFGVWHQTNGCIERFNGETWSRITHNDGLPQGEIVSIACDHDNNLWLCLHNPARIAKFDGQNWTEIYGFGDTITIEHTNEIVVDSSNTVFIGITVNGATSWIYGVVAIKNNDTIIYNYTNSDFQMACRHSSFLDSNNNVWFGGCYNNLYRFDGETWHKEAQIPLFNSYNSYCAIGQDNSGNMILGTGSTLYIGIDHTWQSFTTDNGLLFNTVYDVGCDAQGEIWAACFDIQSDDPRKSCLSRIVDGNITHFFPNTFIGTPKAISFNDNDVYVFGMYGNNAPLSAYNSESWNIDITGEGFYNQSTDAVAVDNMGNTWIGSGILYRRDAVGQIHRIDTLCGDSLQRVVGIETYGNKVWVADKYSKLYFFNGASWSALTIPEDVHFIATRLFARSETEMWVIDYNGKAYKNLNGNWTAYDTTMGFLPNQQIRDIAFTGDELWFATRYGIVKMTDDVLEFYCNDSSYSSGYSDYFTVHADRNGKLWFGNRKSVMFFDGNEPIYVYPTDIVERIYTIREDDNYNIWFCGANALSKLHYQPNSIENNNDSNSRLLIYPNPSSGTVSIEIPENAAGDILEVYSYDGSILQRHIIESGMRTMTYNNLKQGFYIVRLQKSCLYGKVIIE